MLVKKRKIGISSDLQNDLKKISYILSIILVSIIPLIIYPKTVYLIPVSDKFIFHTAFCDISDYYKTVAIFIMAIMMLIILILQRVLHFGYIKLKMPIIFFIIWVFLSTLFAADSQTAIFGMPIRWQGLMTYICYFIIFTFMANMLEFKYVKSLTIILFISAGIISAYSIFQYYNIEPLSVFFNWLGIRKNPSMRATIGNTNSAGAYFVLLSLAAFFYYVKSKKYNMTILSGVFTVLCYAGLLVSLTRGAWIGAFTGLVSILVIFWFDLKKNYKKIIAMFLILAVMTVILDYTGGKQITGRYDNFKAELGEMKEDNNVEQLGSFRVLVYNKALKVMLEHPILGVGPDCFMYYGGISDDDYKKYPQLKKANFIYFDKVHSEYLEYAATMGIPALIFYLWFIISIFVRILKRRRSIRPEVLAIFAGWTGYLIQAVFNIGVISVLPIFFAFSAILEKYLYFENDNAFDSTKTVDPA